MSRTSLKKTVVLERYTQDDKGCWVWNGRIDQGSPRLKIDGMHCLPKKVAWELLKGERLTWKFKLVPCCGKKLCINPDHMEKASALAKI